ncbi:hypothetical protein Tco_1030172 [Tanacetum coccineum]|uniref:Uncharacterized protein n=1 Tax=Tanacetum coccineum TaxID=301880 RepID=A0ABQ5G616_9ASTR
METDEVSERYIELCFVNGLDAYDGEINLALDENFISNEYAVKLCLDYEVKKGNKVVKKELIVAFKGELYFVKFIINPKEDNIEPGVNFGRSFMRLVNGIVVFGSGVITVYPEQDPLEDDYEKTEKSMDDWDQLLDFNFDDIPQLGGEELPPFVCKMGKSPLPRPASSWSDEFAVRVQSFPKANPKPKPTISLSHDLRPLMGLRVCVIVELEGIGEMGGWGMVGV